MTLLGEAGTAGGDARTRFQTPKPSSCRASTNGRRRLSSSQVDPGLPDHQQQRHHRRLHDRRRGQLRVSSPATCSPSSGEIANVAYGILADGLDGDERHRPLAPSRTSTITERHRQGHRMHRDRLPRRRPRQRHRCPDLRQHRSPANWFDSIPAFPTSTATAWSISSHQLLRRRHRQRHRLDVQSGLQTNSFYLADPDGAWRFQNNTVAAYGAGVWQNLTYDNATPLTIDGNTLSADLAPSSLASSIAGYSLVHRSCDRHPGRVASKRGAAHRSPTTRSQNMPIYGKVILFNLNSTNGTARHRQHQRDLRQPRSASTSPTKSASTPSPPPCSAAPRQQAQRGHKRYPQQPHHRPHDQHRRRRSWCRTTTRTSPSATVLTLTGKP